MNQSKKILISGGWGYGNLGDDAILLSLVKVIKKCNATSKIKVMSFNPTQTKETLCNLPFDIDVMPSVHSFLAGSYPYSKLSIYKKSIYRYKYPKIFQRFIGKINEVIFRIMDNYLSKKYHKYELDITQLPFYKAFSSSDIFIQGGGGYFHQEWKDSLLARVLELKTASLAKNKIMIVGQSLTIDKATNIVSDALRLPDIISVRDKESYNIITALGIKCNITPDLALFDIDDKVPSDDLTLIVGDFLVAKMDIFVDVVSSYILKNNIQAKIVLSRLYNCDVFSAKKLKSKFEKKGINVHVVIPNTYKQLHDTIIRSKVVISRNLHGLIIAFKAGVPCICLNDEAKFTSFMKQSHLEKYLLPLNLLSEDRLSNAINDIIDDVETIEVNRLSLQKEVDSNFGSLLMSLYGC